MKTETLESGDLEVWTPEEVNDKLEQGSITLIDVRTVQEFAFERIDGALLFPMQAFSAKNLPCQDSKPIVLHCGSGVRSEKVAEMCLAEGVSRIAHMQDGFAGWKQAKLQYIGTNPQTGAPVKKVDR